MNRILLATSLTAFLFAMPSCSEAAAAATPAGTYTVDLEKIAADALAAEPKAAEMTDEQKDGLKKMITGRFGKTTFTLKDDNTFEGSMEMSMMGMSKKSTTKGTWKIDGDKVTLNTTHEDGKEKASTQTGTFKDNVLTVEMDAQGKKMTMTFNKKVEKK